MTTIKKVLILVATGNEEIETLTPYDVLVRAGAKPIYASVDSHGVYVELSRGAKIVPDTKLESLTPEEIDNFDAVILPGGLPGAKTLTENSHVQKIYQDFYSKGKLVSAICAGSLIAKTSGIAKGGEITSHPSVKDQLDKDYTYQEIPVVVNKNFITSRGPGTALLFSLAIVKYLLGSDKEKEVEGPMMLPTPSNL